MNGSCSLSPFSQLMWPSSAICPAITSPGKVKEEGGGQGWWPRSNKGTEITWYIWGVTLSMLKKKDRESLYEKELGTSTGPVGIILMEA